MNKRQKLVLEQFLNNEEAVIKRLKQVYNQSLKDITTKAKELQDQINTLDQAMESIEDSKELARLKSMKQSKVYQKQYQDALKKQVSSILDNMQVEEFKTVSEYLNKCYEEGFLGTMYDLQGQGIPLCFPMDQESMVRAVQLDSKISKGLYTRLGEDVAVLKKKITAQVSRGISTGMSFQQVAQQLASYTNIGFNNAVRITRTEGHRIQVQGGMDACYKAKDMGADVVKQWDSTLDKRTRDSHTKVDGEIRELDKKFSNGLMFPGDPSGRAEEVINCRCALLQRARWALDADELQTLKNRAEFFGLDKAKNFEDFKKKYLDAVANEAEFGLSYDEKSAVIDYKSFKSYLINEKLRNKTELTADEEKYIKILDVALDKLPSHSGNLQRSLYFGNPDMVEEFMKDYKIGQPIEYNEYISTTKSTEFYNPEGQIQIFIQNASNGKSLYALGLNEEEVLYKRNSLFNVTNIVYQEGKYYILLEEKT